MSETRAAWHMRVFKAGFWVKKSRKEHACDGHSLLGLKVCAGTGKIAKGAPYFNTQTADGSNYWGRLRACRVCAEAERES